MSMVSINCPNHFELQKNGIVLFKEGEKKTTYIHLLCLDRVQVCSIHILLHLVHLGYGSSVFLPLPSPLMAVNPPWQPPIAATLLCFHCLFPLTVVLPPPCTPPFQHLLPNFPISFNLFEKGIARKGAKQQRATWRNNFGSEQWTARTKTTGTAWNETTAKQIKNSEPNSWWTVKDLDFGERWSNSEAIDVFEELDFGWIENWAANSEATHLNFV